MIRCSATPEVIIVLQLFSHFGWSLANRQSSSCPDRMQGPTAYPWLPPYTSWVADTLL